MPISNVIPESLVKSTWGNSVADVINKAHFGVCVVGAGSQSLGTGAYTALVFGQTPEADPNEWINPSNKSQFKPDKAGWYWISCYINIATTSTTTSGEIRKNDATVIRQDNGAPYATPDFNISTLVYLNGGSDYVTILSYQNSGSTQNHSGRLAAHWISE